MNFEAVASSLREGAMIDAAAVDLDASANTAPTPAVIAAVVAAMSHRHGNPSSGHGRGNASRDVLTAARDSLSALVNGAFDDGVVFTSGCTEANNLVLSSFAGGRARIVTSAVEHPSVLTTAKALAQVGSDVTILPVDRGGRIDLESLNVAVRSANGPCLVSLQLANSETGVLQDAAAIAAIVGECQHCYFHADAAQAMGKIEINLGRGVGPDVVTMSGHKIHGPMGIGAIIVADDSAIPLRALLKGGEQERGIRAGTEAVPAIAGLSAAVDEWALHRIDRRRHLEALHRHIEQGLCRIEGAIINGSASSRLPNVTNVTFANCDAMALVANLDAQGIRVSQGSACSTGRPEPSHVLVAMGLSEADAFSTIRISLSVNNQLSEINHAIAVISGTVDRMRGRP
ncbi:cysteine desulfurase family protein [Sphingomonas sp.]|uniref:cysteine desulfurase family protein n=1 Tax=Sphingomonas sp. TaxID=28214 RepID=UPI0025DBEE9D|nr:cysteine desulfurase family protein [Sphingomonas sp.]